MSNKQIDKTEQLEQKNQSKISQELGKLKEEVFKNLNSEENKENTISEENKDSEGIEDNTISEEIEQSEPRLTRKWWVFNWPSGRETYYNLNMSGVVRNMRSIGYSESKYPYHVRNDGVKMLGPYVMVAANLAIRPKGTILPTSLWTWIVCDTWGFVRKYPKWIDIATNW